jgi:hypothetical protein
MERQLAFMANDCAFTGIKCLHCWVKVEIFSESARKFSLKFTFFTGR